MCGFTSSWSRISHCALGEVGEARMSLRGPCSLSVAAKPRCPQFVGIAKFLRLPHANDTSHALASGVIVGSLPGRAHHPAQPAAFATRARRSADHFDAPECPPPHEGLLYKPAYPPAPPARRSVRTALSISTSPYQLLQHTHRPPPRCHTSHPVLCARAHMYPTNIPPYTLHFIYSMCGQSDRALHHMRRRCWRSVREMSQSVIVLPLQVLCVARRMRRYGSY